MISKGLHKFQSRIGYFSVDLEMVNVIRNNIDKFKGDEVIFSGVTKGAHPKLFSYAYKNNLIPESLAEFYYGKETATKKHKEFYPPCREKCRFILPLLLGLDIIYRDDSIVDFAISNGDAAGEIGGSLRQLVSPESLFCGNSNGISGCIADFRKIID